MGAGEEPLNAQIQLSGQPSCPHDDLLQHSLYLTFSSYLLFFITYIMMSNITLAHLFYLMFSSTKICIP